MITLSVLFQIHTLLQSTVPQFYNVGDIVSGKIHLHTLSPHEKFKYLDQHVVPNARMLSERVQTVTRQKEGRSYYTKFQESWLVYFKWLIYSPSAKGGYCKYCVLFFTKDNSTRTKPGVLVATFLQTFGKQPERMAF